MWALPFGSSNLPSFEGCDYYFLTRCDWRTFVSLASQLARSTLNKKHTPTYTAAVDGHPFAASSCGVWRELHDFSIVRYIHRVRSVSYPFVALL